MSEPQARDTWRRFAEMMAERYGESGREIFNYAHPLHSGTPGNQRRDGEGQAVENRPSPQLDKGAGPRYRFAAQRPEPEPTRQQVTGEAPLLRGAGGTERRTPPGLRGTDPTSPGGFRAIVGPAAHIQQRLLPAFRSLLPCRLALRQGPRRVGQPIPGPHANLDAKNRKLQRRLGAIPERRPGPPQLPQLPQKLGRQQPSR
jgi:hypothetical protein